jgi:hypothetical protein
MDDKMANLAVCCMAVAPDGALFAGTGEGFSNIDHLRGAGIFICPGGVKWFQLPSTLTDDFQWVNRLAINNQSQYVILAATLAGMMRSTDQGQSWTNTQFDFFTDVKFHPSDPTRAVAGTAYGHAYYTTDGGATWQQAAPAPSWGGGRIELAYAVAAPDTVYASVNQNNGEIWRSSDGGQTYSKRATLSGGSSAGYLGAQGWYDNVIWAGMPNNAAVVFVGGIDLWSSQDGGNTLTRVSNWWQTGSVHADHHAIVCAAGFDGVNNKTAYFGNDGGIYCAPDLFAANGPIGWTNLNNGYAVTQFYYGAANNASQQLVAGAQDNGTLSVTTSGGTRWVSLYGGDGGDCAADQNDPHTFYGEYTYLAMFRATDQKDSGAYIDGEYWNGSAWSRKAAPYNLSDSGGPGTALFIAPFVIDPSNSARLLAGGGSLWRTNDAKTALTNTTGPSWTIIKPSTGSAKISAIAIAPSNSNVVLVGYNNGQIWSSQNGTSASPTWTQNSPSAGAYLYCTSLTADPLNSAVCYATYGGYGGHTVFRLDATNNWSDITPEGLAVPSHCLVVHPVQTTWLYLGTDMGLWFSQDSGATWNAANAAPTNCAIFDLFWMDTVLAVVTHGRGLFTVDLTTTFDPSV